MAGDKCAATAGCELCGGVAAVHCEADSAFLCISCDAKVHGANFLASRHLRRRLHTDEEEESGSTESSSSSSCLSTADSTATARMRRGRGCKTHRRPRAEVVLQGWAKRMGLATGPARRRASKAAAALRALGRGVATSRVPLRVAMAAALWSEVGAAPGGYHGDAALLLRLEASAHVPARLVVTVASWMVRAARRASAPAEEGWAECSGPAQAQPGPSPSPEHSSTEIVKPHVQ